MNPSITNRTGAKVRFFAIYSLSVLLLFFFVSSFLLPVKKGGAPIQQAGTKSASTIELLHLRMAPLQTATLSFYNGATPETKARVDVQAAAFQALLDSLRTDAATVSDKIEQKKLEDVLQLFNQTVNKEQALLQAFAAAHATTNVAATSPATNDELEELKTILIQKEEKIAALEKQKTPEQAPLKNDDSGEWKEKYNRLKLAAEKSATQLDAMKASYKEVVEDNRRLIGQLQAARAAKN